MKKAFLVLSLLFFMVILPAAAEKINLSGKFGISYWYEDYERKGYGGIYWLNSWMGAEVLLNIDTTSFHDAGGYAGKFKLPFVVKSSSDLFLELVPTLFYRYDNRLPAEKTVITLSPGLWTGVELFAIDQFKNLSFNISAGLDYTLLTTNFADGRSTTLQQLNISVFALGVRYYF